MCCEPRLRPRFTKEELEQAAAAYDVSLDRKVEEVGENARGAGHLDRNGLLELCRWKSRRSANRCLTNSEQYVVEVTTQALSSQNERFRIETLTLLDGVGWPTASVVLHFCSKDPYPILDVRALESLSTGPPGSYTFSFWWDYTECTRRLADEFGMTMRELDRGLWQFSKGY